MSGGSLSARVQEVKSIERVQTVEKGKCNRKEFEKQNHAYKGVREWYHYIHSKHTLNFHTRGERNLWLATAQYLGRSQR